MATHSCILAWKIPWTEEPGRLQSMGSQRVDPMNERLHFPFSVYTGCSVFIKWGVGTLHSLPRALGNPDVNLTVILKEP